MALDFLILYEHVVREYESILLLKAELARRGYTVELRQLLDTLRTRLGLTSVKEGCSEGECGACTVIYNGEPVTSCCILAGQADGAIADFFQFHAKADGAGFAIVHELCLTVFDGKNHVAAEHATIAENQGIGLAGGGHLAQ